MRAVPRGESVILSSVHSLSANTPSPANHVSLVRSLEDVEVEVEAVVEQSPVDVSDGRPGEPDERRVHEGLLGVVVAVGDAEVVEVEEVGDDGLEGGVDGGLVEEEPVVGDPVHAVVLDWLAHSC